MTFFFLFQRQGTIEVADGASMEDIFCSQSDPLTRSKMETLWSRSFPTVLPEPVALNPSQPSFRFKMNAQGQQTCEKIFDYGYYVPFLKSLEQLLNVNSVYESVINSFRNNSSHLASSYDDVWDGSILKSNHLFVLKNGAILVIQIYSDDVELANPLGSKKGKHKITVFYWTLLNLPPQFRSSLRSICLLGVANANLLREHGHAAFLEPFIADMSQLLTGVTLSVRGKKITFHGILLNAVGDMPASNLLGGFKESVSKAVRPCRFCMIHRDQLDSVFHESECILRTYEIHKQQVNRITLYYVV